MRLDESGFFTLESIASLSIVFMIVFTFIPIIQQVTLEEQLLSERRNIQSKLHDELQGLIYEIGIDSLPSSETRQMIDGTMVTFTFTIDNPLVKGCAVWNNAKQQNEQFCLFGYPKQ